MNLTDETNRISDRIETTMSVLEADNATLRELLEDLVQNYSLYSIEASLQEAQRALMAPHPGESLLKELTVTEKALELACNFISEEVDFCFWDESGKVANDYGGYDCDICPHYPAEKCTREWYLQQARKEID